MSSKSESRVLDVFGPNLVIESNGPVGLGGPIAYQLYSVTDKGIKYKQALHASGLSTIEADGTLEIQTGFKNKKNDRNNIIDGEFEDIEEDDHEKKL